MVEATRLCVMGHSNSSMVRSALFKALFQYCNAQKVDWIMAVGRRPIDRIYDALLFSDVADSGKFYPMAHVNGVPHRVMGLRSATQANWAAAQHPLYRFVFETHHADIDLSESSNLNFPWHCPETNLGVDSSTQFLGDVGMAGQVEMLAHSIRRQALVKPNPIGFNAR